MTTPSTPDVAGSPASPCWTDSKLSLSLLVTYQFWCGERVTNAGRAFDVISEMSEAFSMQHKKMAVNFFMLKGWSDTTRKAKDLVDLIWSLKELYPPNAGISGQPSSAAPLHDLVGQTEPRETP